MATKLTLFKNVLRKLAPEEVDANFESLSVAMDAVLGALDVAVFGATPGGIMAALSAAKEGASVSIFEPGNWIGGLTSGGLAWTDVLPEESVCQLTGLSKAFYAELAEDCGLTLQAFFKANCNAAPSVAERRLRVWISNAGIKLITGCELLAVAKEGTQISSVTMSKVGEIGARVWIDASYEGDLLAAAGCSWAIGRESSATYNEVNGGVRPLSNAGPRQFADGVDPYLTPGVAASGLLPGIWPGAWGAVGSADPHVMPFGYRLTLTTDAGKLPVPEPAAYDPLQYELLGRHAAIAGAGWTSAGNVFSLPTLQGGAKHDFNNNAPLSHGYISPVCTEYITATPARRAEIREEIKQYTLGLIKFVKTDARFPAAVRNDVANYGLCPDEFEAYGGFTPQLYIREGRRLVGDFILTENDLAAPNGYSDRVAYAYFPLDTHHTRRLVVNGMVKNEGEVFTAISVGARVPLRVLLPKAAQCTNLLVTFAVSASHSAFSSLRVEPIHMALGQAAGVLAAKAVRRNIAVQSVPSGSVVTALNVDGTVVGGGAIISTDGVYAGGSRTAVGAWNQGSNTFGSISGSHLASSAAGAEQKFYPELKRSGMYKVYVKYPSKDSVARANNTPVTIVHAGGTTALTLDQNSTGQGGDWEYLGLYAMSSGSPSPHYVKIGTNGTGQSSVISAVKFLPA